MEKFFKSVWFNIVLAVLAAVLIIMQEVWIGAPILILNVITLGICAGIGFSLSAEVIKLLFFGGPFSGKNAIIGSILGIIAAIVTGLII